MHRAPSDTKTKLKWWSLGLFYEHFVGIMLYQHCSWILDDGWKVVVFVLYSMTIKIMINDIIFIFPQRNWYISLSKSELDMHIN